MSETEALKATDAAEEGGKAKMKEVASAEETEENGKADEVEVTKREGADSTTTEDADVAGAKAEDGVGKEGGEESNGADENRVTSSDNKDGGGRKRERSQDGGRGGDDDGKRRRRDSESAESRRRRQEDYIRGRFSDFRLPAEVRARSGSAGDDRHVYKDARDRIEDRRRQSRQGGHDSRGGRRQQEVVDYVSRADRVLLGRGQLHCVECNLVFVTERSERLHRDSQRHLAVYEQKKRPVTLTGRETPYACYLCWCTYDSSGQLFRHYAGDEHIERMKKYGIKCLLLDGRKIDGDRSPEPPECIEDCIVLDEAGSEDDETKVEDAAETAGGDVSEQVSVDQSQENVSAQEGPAEMIPEDMPEEEEEEKDASAPKEEAETCEQNASLEVEPVDATTSDAGEKA